jgi:hypothetical protein
MCDKEATRTRKKYSSIISYLAGVFSLFLALRVLLGNPMVGLVFGLAFREIALYGGMGRKYRMGCFGGLLCVIRADMVNG